VVLLLSPWKAERHGLRRHAQRVKSLTLDIPSGPPEAFGLIFLFLAKLLYVPISDAKLISNATGAVSGPMA
jgi:hypothetical protein